MVSVASLLNPISSADPDCYQLPSPCSSRYRSEDSAPPNPPYKKQKMSKDAAIFARGKIQGEVRYPPCEVQDERIAAEHRKFQVYPIGQIAEYRRHIPYNSEKKSFLEKTGRGAFEVFQYTFKVPPEDRAYTVMWDYNVGLVRITPFFKCCQYAKTMPAKMLNSNPGLREICHSITGGALAAQGYWMPFEAAKAVAATFCYHIRYALTPVFGLDFLKLCIKPGEEGFGHMVIDANLVRKCTVEATEYRAMSREGSLVSSPSTPEAASPSITKWTAKSLRPKQARPLESESGYYTDTDRSDQCNSSPHTTFDWTASDAPRSINQQFRMMPSQRSLTDGCAKRSCGGPPNSPDSSSSEEHHKTVGKAVRSNGNNDDQKTAPNGPPLSKRKRRSTISTKDTRAAYLLMQLHFADASLKDSSKRRRASS